MLTEPVKALNVDGDFMIWEFKIPYTLPYRLFQTKSNKKLTLEIKLTRGDGTTRWHSLNMQQFEVVCFLEGITFADRDGNIVEVDV